MMSCGDTGNHLSTVAGGKLARVTGKTDYFLELVYPAIGAGRWVQCVASLRLDGQHMADHDKSVFDRHRIYPASCFIRTCHMTHRTRAHRLIGTRLEKGKSQHPQGGSPCRLTALTGASLMEDDKLALLEPYVDSWGYTVTQTVIKSDIDCSGSGCFSITQHKMDVTGQVDGLCRLVVMRRQVVCYGRQADCLYRGVSCVNHVSRMCAAGGWGYLPPGQG